MMPKIKPVFLIFFLLSCTSGGGPKDPTPEHEPKPTQSTPTVKALASLVIGSVKIDNRPLKLGDTIQPASLISCGDKSAAEIQFVFDEKSFISIKMKKNTQVRSYLHSIKDGKFILLEVLQGNIMVKTKKWQYGIHIKILTPHLIALPTENSTTTIIIGKTTTKITGVVGISKIRPSLPGFLEALSFQQLQQSGLATILKEYYDTATISLQKGSSIPIGTEENNSYLKQMGLKDLFTTRELQELMNHNTITDDKIKNALAKTKLFRRQ